MTAREPTGNAGTMQAAEWAVLWRPGGARPHELHKEHWLRIALPAELKALRIALATAGSDASIDAAVESFLASCLEGTPRPRPTVTALQATSAAERRIMLRIYLTAMLRAVKCLAEDLGGAFTEVARVTPNYDGTDNPGGESLPPESAP